MTAGTIRREPQASDVTTPRAGFVLAPIVTCQLMIVLDVTVVNVALPPIQQDLGFTSTGLSWVVNAYTLPFGGLLPPRRPHAERHKLANWSGGRRSTCPSYEIQRVADGVRIAVPGVQPFNVYDVITAN